MPRNLKMHAFTNDQAGQVSSYRDEKSTKMKGRVGGRGASDDVDVDRPARRTVTRTCVVRDSSDSSPSFASCGVFTVSRTLFLLSCHMKSAAAPGSTVPTAPVTTLLSTPRCILP